MYHYITIGDIKIYMTWLGILLTLAVFTFTLRRYLHAYKLEHSFIRKRLPLYGIALYLFSTYTWYAIESFVIIPLSWKQLLMYFSPTEYRFHLVWILIACLGIGRDTLRHVPIPQHEKWLDSLFHSITIACIPLGIFLLLGDNFIGMTTDTSYFVTAIRPDSNMAVYGKVFPLWLMVSVWWLACHVAANIFADTTKRKDVWKWFAIFSLWLIAITMLQQYPRHLVMSLGTVIFDIKQYVLLLIAILFFVFHIQQQRQ
jgi:hypothetical protein